MPFVPVTPETVGELPVKWQPIETAPKDGTHIIIASASNTPPTTVHWFDGGWHLSVNMDGDHSEYVWGRPTHWMPAPDFPSFANT